MINSIFSDTLLALYIITAIITAMKIILATPIYPPEIGGPATYIKELVERLRDQHELTVVALSNNQNEIPGSKLLAIDKQNKLPVRLWLFFKTIYKASKDADLLYVQNAMAAGLPSVIAGKLRRKPVIIKFVGDEGWERAIQHKKTTKLLQDFLENPDAGFKINLMMFIQGWTLRNCTLITTPSQYLGELITKIYKLDPSKVVTNYNAAEQVTDSPFETEKKPHQLVATARLVEHKGIDGIIKAVKLLQEKYPDVSLIIHGDGPKRAELEKLAQDEGVADKITFTGNVSRTETFHTRKTSAVYLLNSTYEGLPHTALTSFSAKIPIVATDTDGTNEAVYHEESGLLVPKNNPEAVAKAVARLFEDQNLQDKVVAGGSKILAEKFSWESHLKTLNSFFKKVVT